MGNDTFSSTSSDVHSETSLLKVSCAGDLTPDKFFEEERSECFSSAGCSSGDYASLHLGQETVANSEKTLSSSVSAAKDSEAEYMARFKKMQARARASKTKESQKSKEPSKVIWI